MLRHTSKLERQSIFGHLGWLRGAIGATLGILFAGLVSFAFFDGISEIYPLLVAPLGASAVLVFAVPASPLAQPWPFIGGNLVSCVIGLGAGHAMDAQLPAAAIAVGAAIAAMTLLRCLHPPGGACALLCALGSTGAQHWGLDYLIPISTNVLTVAAVGWAFNNLSGHRWPHVQLPAPRPEAGTSHYTREDIRDVLDEWDDVLDIDIDDLDAVFKAVERKAEKRSAKP